MGWFKKKELRWPKPKEKYFSSIKTFAIKRKVNVNLKSGKCYQFIVTPIIYDKEEITNLFPNQAEFLDGYHYYKLDDKKYNELYHFKYMTKDVSYDGPVYFEKPWELSKLEFGGKENKFIINVNEIESLQIEELEKIEYIYNSYWT